MKSLTIWIVAILGFFLFLEPEVTIFVMGAELRRNILIGSN